MAHEFDPRFERTDQSGPEVAEVHDTIVIPTGLTKKASPGLAVILKEFPHEFPGRYVGGMAWIGSNVEALRIEAVRDHASTISFLFLGLNQCDVPIGSQVRFLACESAGQPNYQTGVAQL